MFYQKNYRPFAVCLAGVLAWGLSTLPATAQDDLQGEGGDAVTAAEDTEQSGSPDASQLPPVQAAGSDTSRMVGQPQDFDEEVPRDSFFDFDEAEAPADAAGEKDADERTDWNDMINSSFGTPDEYQASLTDDAAEPVMADTPKQKINKPETNLEILPPVDIGNRLIDASSLPLLASFGNDGAANAAWPKGKTWLTGQLPVARTYNIKGCRFHLKTGPLSLAHYELADGEYVTVTDSMRPMTTVRPEPGKQDLFLAANADLYPEVDAGTTAACVQHIKGKIIPIGKFDLGATVLQLKQTALKYSVEVVDRSVVKPVQVYLYWPKGRNDPILIDNSGLYPVMSSPIFKVSAAGKGSGLIEVIPHLSYTKGGKALTRKQLQEFWGER